MSVKFGGASVGSSTPRRDALSSWLATNITASAVSLHVNRPELRGEGNDDFLHLFWMLCAVLAANVVVAFIAITKAYHNEGRSLFSELGNRHKLSLVEADGGDIAKVTALKFSPK